VSEPDKARHRRWRALRADPRWRWIARGAALAFLLLVASLVVIEARKVHWREVFTAIQSMPWPVLAAASGFAMASHLLYSTFDLLGRRYTGHSLSTRAVMAITFVSYAFNLNMGTLVGGAGIRFRLYLQLGLALNAIARIVTLSIMTNWLGYMVLAGAILLWRPFALPYQWMKDTGIVDVIGVAVIAVPLFYVTACARSRRRVVQFRGHKLTLPSFRLAVAQLVLSCANWMAIGGVVYMLLQQRVDYPAVLGALLAAAVAGVVSHIPGGLGVLEAVFVALLSDRVPKEQLIAALLTYRGIYYLVPLFIAAPAYFLFEARMRQSHRARDSRRAAPATSR